MGLRHIEGSGLIRRDYFQFLVDESKTNPAIPDSLYFPRDTGETAEAVRRCIADDYAFTVSSGRTGIGGGAAPAEGSRALISLENLQSKVTAAWDDTAKCWTATAAAGMRLQEFQRIIKQKEYLYPDGDKQDVPSLFFPVDPTETTATLGGMAATNASGARTLHFGPMRSWILGCTVVLADGTILTLKRGDHTAVDGVLHIPAETDGNSGTGSQQVEKQIAVEPINIPETKHTAGYYLTEKTDLIDLFIGSEGTLGIITELTLRLTEPAPAYLYTCIFLDRDRPVKLIEGLLQSETLDPVAIEYMDHRSLRLLEEFRAEQAEASGVPLLPAETQAAVYVELSCTGADPVLAKKEAVDELSALLSSLEISSESVWSGFSAQTLDQMKRFRHALPERINSIIAERKKTIPKLTKIGTDMAVPIESLGPMLNEYRTELERRNLAFVIFGHIGNGHVHVNILPRDEAGMESAWEAYTVFARSVCEKQGSICAEHGIGRLKRKLMPIQFTTDEIDAMKRVKSALDPEGRLNPGVLFPD